MFLTLEIDEFCCIIMFNERRLPHNDEGSRIDVFSVTDGFSVSHFFIAQERRVVI